MIGITGTDSTIESQFDLTTFLISCLSMVKTGYLNIILALSTVYTRMNSYLDCGTQTRPSLD